jgi:four helix bundle protein
MEPDDFLTVEEQEPVYNIRHRAFYFSKDIINFISEQRYDKIYSSLFDQLLRSATSVGANLVEGSAGASKKDFIKYYTIALKSANETKYWLYLLKETLLQNNEQTVILINEVNEISKVIGAIIVNAKKNQV